MVDELNTKIKVPKSINRKLMKLSLLLNTCKEKLIEMAFRLLFNYIRDDLEVFLDEIQFSKKIKQILN